MVFRLFLLLAAFFYVNGVLSGSLTVTTPIIESMTLEIDESSEEVEEVHSDFRPAYESDNLYYRITTNSLKRIEFGIKISNAANDVWCEKSFIYSSSSVSKLKSDRRSQGFSRMDSPSIALYEWHICFIVNDVIYKAWRGFDPGSNGRLDASCFIPKDIAKTFDKANYLCKTDKVEVHNEIYSDYRSECDEEFHFRNCKQFESEESYQLWKYYANNPSVLEDLALAVLSYNYERHNQNFDPYEVNININGNTPTKEFIARLSNFKLIYNSNLEYKYYIGVLRPWSKTKVSVKDGSFGGNASYIVELRKGKWKVINLITGKIY